jgi:glyoxylase-like metal-dependent hydrolase (beta-lactamase superfamily II)
MKRLIFAIALVFAIGWSRGAFGAAPHFIKVSDHCYYLQLKESGENVAVVVTEDGVLMVDPPPEPDLTLAMDALKSVTSKTVRWTVFTEPRFSQNAGSSFFAERGSMLLASAKLRALSASGAEPRNAASPGAPSSSWFIFEHQMRLFPSNLEIRIIAVQPKARTGGDVVVFVPSEKVLFVGGLFEAARYPDIDILWEGSAVGWIDGMKQVIDSVPILKSAIPQAKSDPKLEQDKAVEEGISVISVRGEASNLQNMKDLLESAKKLRNDISKAIKAGRTCDNFLTSPASDPYRSYANFAPFATQLFAEAGPAPPTR